MILLTPNYKAGDIYGKVVLTGKGVIINRNRKVEYVCECGKIGWARLVHLRTQKTISCGCYSITATIARETTHGKTNHPLYHIWGGMIQRCYDKKLISYHRYGGNGVTVCEEWRNDFETFYTWAIKNGWRKGLCLDKDKLAKTQTGFEYSPLYCCFITQKENNRHTSQNVMISYQGQEKCLGEWCEELNIPYKKIHYKVRKLKLSAEKAFAI